MHLQWAVSLEPFIPFGNQIIAALDTLFVSTARGLYALNAENGALRWVFPTEMPLGNSPTIEGNVVYVGGYDRRLYALDALTGRKIWEYEAGGGFATNPLVVEEKVILGNRDGWLYAINMNGTLAWKFQTGGPILFSAAYKDGVVYFASNDSYAYALNADDGTLRWRSDKLPGNGFDSYWPVIYTVNGDDYVVLGGGNNYRLSDDLSVGMLNNSLDRTSLYEDIPEGELVGPTGTEPGDWAAETVTIDNNRAVQYLETNPSRRRVFILNTDNGQEYTFDSDGDSKPEYAPITWYGTHGGNRYPAVIGGDGVMYLGNSYVSNPYIPRGGPSGWKFGTQYISRVHAGNYGAVDEPLAVSGGGDLIHWAWFSGRDGMGAYDITLPYGAPERNWVYWANGSPDYVVDTCPGAGAMFGQTTFSSPYEYYTSGATYGIYRRHGNQNPPIPYKGKIYFHALNTVFALSATQSTCQVDHLPAFEADPMVSSISKEDLRQNLISEIEKILEAGHLRPGYYHGTLGTYHLGKLANSYMTDYFHNPAETFVTMIDALPHLPTTLQQEVREYLQSEWYIYGDKVHIGWRDGVARETFEIPPEIQVQMDNFTPKTSIYGSTWDYRYSIYGRWRYIKEFADTSLAKQVFAQIRDTMPINPPAQDSQVDGIYNPYIKNAYIAGYIGYIEIGRMAGIVEAELAPYVTELNHLMVERASEFSKDQPPPVRRANTVSVARNFMYMTPELGAYLRANAAAKVQAALKEYNQVAPYWFVSKYNATSGEGVLQPLYDYPALFQAKALILQEPFDELVKWIDVPAFERGDLFYIQNLIAALEATSLFTKTAQPSIGFQGDTVSYTLKFRGQGDLISLTDTLPSGVSQPANVEIVGSDIEPQYNSDTHALEWSDAPEHGKQVTIQYSVTIETSESELLVNSAYLMDSFGDVRTTEVIVFANPNTIYLPLLMRSH
jgi:outer membrane protein assembly factor BamB